MRTIKKLTDFQEITYRIGGHDLNVNSVTNLKVYANNTVYINKNKVQLTDEEVQLIDTANCEFFITSVINDNSIQGEIFLKDGEFRRTKRMSFSGNLSTNQPEKLIQVLSSNGISVTEL